MKKSLQFLTLLALLVVPWVSQSQNVVEIGDGTTTDYYTPIGTYYNYSITEQLYTAEEIGMAGNITSISFSYASTTAADLPITVYMMHTDAADLSTGISLADADEVFDGILSVTEPGWATINLNAPFAYDGTSNLLIGINKGYLYYYSGNTWNHTSTTAYMARYSQNDGSGYTTSDIPSNTRNGRPNIQLTIVASSGPVCEKPSTFDVTNITTNSAIFTWNSTVDDYTFEYKKSSDAEWTVITGLTDSIYTLNNLDPGTSYSARVKAVCGTDFESGYKTVSFTTMYGIPLIEEFAASSVPANWTRYSGLLSSLAEGTPLTAATSGWNFGASNGAFGGSSHARTNIYGTNCKYWLVTPTLMMEDDVQLMFDVAYTAYSGTMADPSQTGTDDKFVVLITTNNGTTWEILRQYDNDSSDYVLNNITPAGTTVAIDLSAYAGQNIAIAFYAESTESNADNNLHIDNVSIDYIPSCAKPVGLAMSNVTAHEATLSWTSDASAWQIQLGEDDVTDVTETNYTFTGLTPETAYSVMVRANCGGTYSEWSNAVSFTTGIACPAPTGLAAFMTPGDGSTATITWVEAGEATEWQICFNEDTTNYIDVYDSSYTFTDLTPEQTYTVKVRAICGGEDGVSAWSDILSFQPSTKTVIGSGSATNQYIPTYTLYNYSLTQQIYTVAELGDASAITSIDFFCSADKTRTLDIYMVSTTKQSFADGYDWIPVTSSDLVYSGSVDFAAGAWTTITLDDPFAYDGTNNVAIIVDDNTGSWETSPNFLAFTADSQAIRVYSDPTNYDPSAPSSYSGTVLNVKNQIRLAMGDAPTCAKPTNLTVDDVTANSVTLSWTDEANSNATYSVYQMNATGATQIATGINTTTYTVTGLDAQTGYTFGVEANCSATDASTMATVSATTECEGGSCNIYIYAQDSYGDGWNNASVAVMQGNATVSTYTMAGQGVSSTTIYDTATISVCAGAPISFSWTSGQWDGEITLGIANANGEVVYSAAGSDLTSGETFFTMESCTAEAGTPDTVNECTVTDLPYTESFEAETTCWSFIDADGDGHGWEIGNENATPYSGTYCLSSASYEDQFGALTPNNWAISPAIELPASADTIMLSWFVAPYSANYGEEKYSVYLSTSGNNPSNFTTELYTETLNHAGYEQRIVDLSAYAGQTVYIAFRHYDCTDQWYLEIDNIAVTLGAPEAPASSTITVVNNGGGYMQVYHNSNSDYFYGTSETRTYTYTSGSFYVIPYTFTPEANNNYGLVSDSAVRVVSVTVDGESVNLQEYLYANYLSSGYIYYLISLPNDYEDHTVVVNYAPYYDATSCENVPAFAISEVTGDGASLYWIPSIDGNNQNTVYAYSDDFEVVYTATVSGLSHTITGLQPYTHYYVRVGHTCNSGEEKFTYYSEFTTGGPMNTITIINNGGGELHTTDYSTTFGEGTTTVSGNSDSYINLMAASDDEGMQLNAIVFDGDTVAIDGTDERIGIYDQSNTYGYIIYYFTINYDTNHVVEFIYGPYIHTINCAVTINCGPGVYAYMLTDTSDVPMCGTTHIANTAQETYYYTVSGDYSANVTIDGAQASIGDGYINIYNLGLTESATVNINTYSNQPTNITVVNNGGGFLRIINNETNEWTYPTGTEYYSISSSYIYIIGFSFAPSSEYYSSVSPDAARLTSLTVDGVEVNLDDIISYSFVSDGYYSYHYQLNHDGMDHVVVATFGPYYDSTVCAPIITLNPSEVYDVSANIYWADAISGTNQYYIELMDASGQTTTYSSTESHYSLTGLQGSTEYGVRVYYLCANGETAYSDWAYFTTSAPMTSYTVVNNGGGYLRVNSSTTVYDTSAFSGAEGSSICFYTYSWEQDNSQLNSILLDGVPMAIDGTDSRFTLNDHTLDYGYITYDFCLDYDSNNHTVEFVYGPYVSTVSCPVTIVCDSAVTVYKYDNDGNAVNYCGSHTSTTTREDFYYELADGYVLDDIIVTGTDNYYWENGEFSLYSLAQSEGVTVEFVTHQLETHTITVNTNGGRLVTYYNGYQEILNDTTFTNTSDYGDICFNFESGNPEYYTFNNVSQDRYELKHLYVDGVDILPYGEYYAEDFSFYGWSDGDDYFGHDLCINFGADHTVEAVYGPFNTCRPTSNIWFYNITDNSAYVAWNTNSENTYTVTYGQIDTVTNTLIESTLVTLYPESNYAYLSNLQPSTLYGVTVTTLCDSSSTSTIRTFSTYGQSHTVTVITNGGYLYCGSYGIITENTTVTSYEGQTLYFEAVTFASYDIVNMYELNVPENRLELKYVYIDGVQIPLNSLESDSWEGITDYFVNIDGDADHTVQFIYTPIGGDLYLLTTSSNNESLGHVYPESGYYESGSTVNVYAIPQPGTQFVSWSNGGTTNPTAVTITSDVTLTATFASGNATIIHDTILNPVHDTVTITNIVYDTTVVTNTVHDTVTVTNTVHDTTVVTNTVYDTLTVTNTVHDTTVVTNTVYDTLTVTNTVHDTLYIYLHDTIYIHDTIVVGMEKVENIDIKLYSVDGQVVVEGTEGDKVVLYDAVGRQLAVKRDEYGAVRFDVPASGTYLVRVGSHAARRIVVIR